MRVPGRIPTLCRNTGLFWLAYLACRRQEAPPQRTCLSLSLGSSLISMNILNSAMVGLRGWVACMVLLALSVGVGLVHAQHPGLTFHPTCAGCEL